MASVKQHLRNQLLQQRNSLDSDKQIQTSKIIAKHVMNSKIYKNAKNIATYHAVNFEADPAPLQHDSQKQFYLPVLAKDKKQGLLFAPLHENSQFKLNQFSIPEPVCPANEQLKGEQLDLVLVPLLGFDCRGNRLGMGGGFYDRCFAFKNHQETTPDTPLLVGFAYAFQQLDTLDPECWDVRLDFIVTENGLLAC